MFVLIQSGSSKASVFCVLTRWLICLKLIWRRRCVEISANLFIVIEIKIRTFGA